MKNSIEVLKRFKVMDLVRFIGDAPNEIDISIKQNEITLENESLRLTYCPHAIEATDALYLDLFTNPVIRISGTVRCSKFLLDEFHSYEIIFLSADPKDNSKDCFVLAESSIDYEINIDDLGDDKKLYEQIKAFEKLRDIARADTYVHPDQDWFGVINYILYFVSEKYNFPTIYKKFRTEHGPTKKQKLLRSISSILT